MKNTDMRDYDMTMFFDEVFIDALHEKERMKKTVFATMRRMLSILIMTAMLVSALTGCFKAPDTSGVTEPPVPAGSRTDGEREVSPGGVAEETDGTEETNETEETEETELFVHGLLESMSLEEKAAQMLLVRCPESGGAAEMEKYGIGGYVLFGRDFDGLSRETVEENIKSYLEAPKIIPVIAVDEEGGTVCRVSSQEELRSERFKSPGELLKNGGLDAVRSDSLEKSEFLASFGINVNLAPVADVTTDGDAFMFRRASGLDTDGTCEYVETAVSAMKESSIGSVLKHFPGYGHAVDTHTGMAEDTRTFDEVKNTDIPPFVSGTEAGGGTCAVMVTHVISHAFDSENPASLSSRVYDYLRNDMGFDGVAMTDDLDMGAITEFCKEGEVPCVTAIKAGCDMVILSDHVSAVAAITEAVEKGELTKEEVDTHVLRILRWKAALGII